MAQGIKSQTFIEAGDILYVKDGKTAYFYNFNDTTTGKTAIEGDSEQEIGQVVQVGVANKGVPEIPLVSYRQPNGLVKYIQWDGDILFITPNSLYNYPDKKVAKDPKQTAGAIASVLSGIFGLFGVQWGNNQTTNSVDGIAQDNTEPQTPQRRTATQWLQANGIWVFVGGIAIAAVVWIFGSRKKAKKG